MAPFPLLSTEGIHSYLWSTTMVTLHCTTQILLLGKDTSKPMQGRLEVRLLPIYISGLDPDGPHTLYNCPCCFSTLFFIFSNTFALSTKAENSLIQRAATINLISTTIFKFSTFPLVKKEGLSFLHQKGG